MNQDQYALSDKLLPDATRLLEKYLCCKIKQTEKSEDGEEAAKFADRAFHQDFRVFSRNKLFKFYKLSISTIDGPVFRPQRTFTGDWKRSTYDNWDVQGRDTITWSEDLEYYGECDLLVWFYADKSDKTVAGWVIAAWKGYLREALYDQRRRQIAKYGPYYWSSLHRGGVIKENSCDNKPFRYMHLGHLLDPSLPFQRHIIGYEVSTFAHLEDWPTLLPTRVEPRVESIE